MQQRLEDKYFEALYGFIFDEDDGPCAPTYWNVSRILHSLPFTYTIDLDENRKNDGLDLRVSLLENSDRTSREDIWWFDYPCSVLEMIVALSDRMSLQTSLTRYHYFLEILHNLGIDLDDDEPEDSIYSPVVNSVETMLGRSYNYDGRGGMFPLERPRQDQRKVEIWYQMGAYLIENRKGVW